MHDDAVERVSLGEAVTAAEVSRREGRKNPAIAAGLSLIFNGLLVRHTTGSSHEASWCCSGASLASLF